MTGFISKTYWSLGAACGPLLFLWPIVVFGQDKKPEKKASPQVVMVAPLGITPGTTTKVIIRGMKLEAATEVRFQGSQVKVKLLNKRQSPVPKKELAALMGDTQVEVEVTIPSGLIGNELAFVVVTPGGETLTHKILLDKDFPTLSDKEPNNSFREAQAIRIPQIIEGTIQNPQDVDVFRLDGTGGQRLVFEVQAARLGSALDSLLILYDSAGHEIATNDDFEGGTDSRLEFILPQNGTYYLSLTDANDQGGQAYPYRLLVRPQ